MTGKIQTEEEWRGSWREGASEGPDEAAMRGGRWYARLQKNQQPRLGVWNEERTLQPEDGWDWALGSALHSGRCSGAGMATDVCGAGGDREYV